MPDRAAGFRGEFLWELEIATRQTMAAAEAMPADKYDWRPDATARSLSEVCVHVATGNFMLLDFLGFAAPEILYPQLAPTGVERFAGLMRRNDELALSMREKDPIVALLKRSLDEVARCVSNAEDSELESRLHFFGEETTARRVYLRLLAHTHEHMGQMIAYLRVNGIAIPWPDWRPDRRSAAGNV